MTIVNTTTWSAAYWQEPIEQFKDSNGNMIPYHELNGKKWFGRMANVEGIIIYRNMIDAVYAWKLATKYTRELMDNLSNVYMDASINVYKISKLYSIELDISFSGSETSNDYEFEAHMYGGNIIDRMELNGGCEQFAIAMASGGMQEYWIGGAAIG